MASFGRPTLVIVFVALGLATVCTLVAAYYNARYLETHPYYGDTASYTWWDFEACFRARQEGRWAAVWHEATTNNRRPFRLIPVLAMNPEWLSSGNGHLITAGFALGCFLGMLGLAAYQRSGSFAYALVALCSILLARSLFDPIQGLAANHPDFVAALFVGSAYLSLLLSDQGRRNGYLVAFGVFASLAALSRWVAAAHTFFVCAPPLAYYLILRWRAGDRLRWQIAWKLLCIALPIALLAGYYLAAFTHDNLQFYSACGYALGSPMERSLDNLRSTCGAYLGRTGYLGLAALCIAYFIYRWRDRASWADLVVTAWAPIAFAFLFVVILKVSGDPQQPFYEIVLLHIFLITPFAARRDAAPPRVFTHRFAPAAIAVIFGVAAWSLYAVGQARSQPPARDAAELTFQISLANLLIEQGGASPEGGRHPTFDTFFHPDGRSLVLQACSRQGERLCWRQIFEKHDLMWRVQYPGMQSQQIAEEAYRRVLDRIDYVAILDDPYAKAAESLFWDDYRNVQAIAQEVIRYINERLRTDVREWSYCGQVESPWGMVSLYRRGSSSNMTARYSTARGTSALVE